MLHDLEGLLADFRKFGMMVHEMGEDMGQESNREDIIAWVDDIDERMERIIIDNIPSEYSKYY